MSADPTRTSPAVEVPTASHVPEAVTTSAAGKTDTPRTNPPASGVAAGYEILGELGRGGMGVVYKARDVGLNRTVALKMIVGTDTSSTRTLVRFRAEAEAVAAVRHPNVVQVYESGERAGHPFIALEYLSGGSLADRLGASSDPSPPARPGARVAVELVGKIAAGVAAAHDAGIVHRDLKPGNVLFDEKGEPKVTDFGLAKWAARADLTQTGAILGTPAYMAPEQAAGEAKYVGPPADVWAIGVILYESLTGRRPFRADTTSELLVRIRTADLVPPRTLIPLLPRDLDLVCRKCLEKNPADRYATAAELAADLDRLARGEPISIRPAGLLERTYKWAKRKPAVAGLYAATAAATVLLAFVGVVAWLWRDSEAARRAAESQRADTETARDALGVEKSKVEALNGELEEKNQELAGKNEQIAFLNYTASLNLAFVAYQVPDLPRANALLADCPSRFRGWEWWYLRRLCNQHRAYFDAGGSADALTTDGRLLLVRTAAEIRLVDAGTGRAVFVLPHPRKYNDRVVLSGDGSRLAVEGPGQTVRVFDTAAGREAFAVREPVAWPVVELSPDGRQLAAVDAKDGGVRVWGPDGTVVFRLAPDRPVRADRVAFSPDGTWIVTHASDARLRVWDAATGRAVADAPAPDQKLLPPHAKLTFVGRGERFALAPGNSPVRVYDTTTARELFQLPDASKGKADGGNPPALVRLVGSPDGKLIATGYQNTLVQVWDAATGRRVCVYTPPEGAKLMAGLNDLSFSPDSTRVLVTDAPATVSVMRRRVRVLDATTGRILRQFTPDPTMLRAWFLSGGDWVLTAHQEGRVYVREMVDTGTVSVALPVGAVAAESPLSADGRWLMGVDRGGAALLWDVATGGSVTDPAVVAAAGPVRRTRPVALPLRAVVRDGAVSVFDPANRPVALPRAAVRAVSAAVSPDGDRVVVVGEDGRTRVYAVPGGEELVRFDHPGPVLAASFTQDGRHVTIRSREFELVVCDAGSGRKLLTIRDTSLTVEADRVVVAPDGRRVAVTQQPAIVRIWDAVSDRLLLDGISVSGQAVGFTPDGRRLVMSAGNAFQVIDCAPVGAPADWKP